MSFYDIFITITKLFQVYFSEMFQIHELNIKNSSIHDDILCHECVCLCLQMWYVIDTGILSSTFPALLLSAAVALNISSKSAVQFSFKHSLSTTKNTGTGECDKKE